MIMGKIACAIVKTVGVPSPNDNLPLSGVFVGADHVM